MLEKGYLRLGIEKDGGIESDWIDEQGIDVVKKFVRAEF